MGPILVLWVAFGLNTTSFAKDWDFTPLDFARIKNQMNNDRAGKDFSYTAQSDWIPPEFRDNLVATLRKVLDPKEGKRNTAGVTPRDFFHGHIVCKKPNHLKSHPRFVSSGRVHAKLNEDMRDALMEYSDPDWNWDVGMLLRSQTKALAALPALREIYIKEWHDYLLDVLSACPQAAVVYHTYEFARPSGLGDNDPRRHLETSRDVNGVFQTREITEPDYWHSPEDSPHSIYDEFFEFQFLINKDGVIYLHPGTDYFFLTMPGFTLEHFKRCSATSTSLPEDRLD